MFKQFLKKDFWDLVYVFVWRELKIKYAQTHLGLFWVLFPPLMALIVVSFFFGNLMKVSHEIPHYNIFAYSGMMAWYYFSYVISYSSISLIQNQEIVQKSPVPRIVFPLAKSISGLFDLIAWYIVVIILMLADGLNPGFSIMLLPFIFFMNFVAGFSMGIWISAFSIKWRDIYQLVPYIIGFTMLITPVLYHPNMIPEKLKIFLYLNPIAGVIALYRKIFVHTSEPMLSYFYGFAFSLLLLVLGLIYFHKQDKIIAERL